MSRFGLTLAIVTLLAPAVIAQETFKSQVVVCQQGDAAEAGRDAMRGGGNAVDAAVATAFALAVTHPAAGNIGGGGFLVAYLGRVEAGRHGRLPRDSPEGLDRADVPGRGRQAPTRPSGRGARGRASRARSRGLGLAHAKWGRRPWAELVRPAAKLAREGFPITATLARSLNAQIFPRDPVRRARGE